MNCWLLCKSCGTRELVTPNTDFGPCPHCKSERARFAQADDGSPMIVFSESFETDFESLVEGVPSGSLNQTHVNETPTKAEKSPSETR